MLLDSPTKCDLFSDLRAGRAGELQSSSICLDGDDFGARGSRPDVDHEHFVLCKLGNLGLFSVCCLDTQQATEEEVVHFEFGVDRGELATEAKYETDQTIGTAKGRVDACTNTWRTLDTECRSE